MLAKSLDQVAASDLFALVANSVQEGRTIEYKEQLQLGSDEERREFLADVSSFANAAGGDIIYGIAEQRDANNKPTGIPSSVIGLANVNVDQERLRLDSIIRDGVQPRIQGIQIRGIEAFPNGPAIVIRIPRSWSAPHMVTFKGSSRFFARRAGGKTQLGVDEIRSAFLLSDSIAEKVRRFRDERIGRLVAGDTPVKLHHTACVALHLIPLLGLAGETRFDLTPFASGQVFLRPLGSSGSNGRPNLDGFLSYAISSDDQAYGTYAQIFRNGAFEAVESLWSRWDQGKPPYIASGSYEHHAIECLESNLECCRKLGLVPPFVVMLTFVGVRGLRFVVNERHFPGRPVPLADRDVMVFSDVLIEDWPNQGQTPLRPIFDHVWQAFGFRGCPHFSEAGVWQRP